jgi:uroporphyrin-III C-methyltransferase/precorrin-2 dehydrogenase/sirohydrochlorin ferrochelatase/uroporphyrin-III C-methyltransferase
MEFLPMSRTGFVHLIGAGPGDPDLLTVKAARLIQGAKLVVHDRLVGAGVMELIGPEAQVISVGKETDHHSLPQGEINALLVKLAQEGRDVVRLKGGDPFVFGRGGEEALYLAEHGIGFEIVPGVSAAVGCAASTGVPLTHRGLATSVRFVTGHMRENDGLDLDWKSLADPACTLVVYMGIANAGRITDGLLGAGLPASTPAMLIESGTTPQQRVMRTTLADMPATIKAHGFHPPSLMVIGKVVEVGAQLAEWMGKK